MIKSEEIFTRIAELLRANYPGISVYPERVSVPASFPCVWAVEADTYPTLQGTALDFTDEQRRSVYEIQAFSNLSKGALAQVRNIMYDVTALLRSLGYRMTMNSPIQNADPSIKRYSARFERIIGGGDTLPPEE